MVFMLPEKDKHIHTKKQLLAQLRVTFGGRISEDMFCGDISSGAAMDIRQATAIARAMVTEFGMSKKLGFQLLGLDEAKMPWEQPEKTYSDGTAKAIDEEIKAIIDSTYSEATEMLSEHRDELDRLAKALLKYETLNHDEVDRIMKGQPMDKPTVGDLLKAEQEKIEPQPTQTPASGDQLPLEDEPPGVMPSPA